MFKDDACGKQIVEFVILRDIIRFTEEINKITLSSDDDKRVIMADGTHTLAYGHTNLKKL